MALPLASELVALWIMSQICVSLLSIINTLLHLFLTNQRLASCHQPPMPELYTIYRQGSQAFCKKLGVASQIGSNSITNPDTIVGHAEVKMQGCTSAVALASKRSRNNAVPHGSKHCLAGLTRRPDPEKAANHAQDA